MTFFSSSENTPAAYAAKLINQTNRHIFLTGKAGTGKTTFLKNILQHTHKKAIVVAPTGIAAINAGGVTIHSQFQLPFGSFIPSRQFRIPETHLGKVNNPDTLLRHMQMNSTKRKLIREIELLVIDEVSMLRADLLDAINTVLKAVRKSTLSFGGVQVLFIGDMLQLPPVVKEDEWQILKHFYKSIFFFDAEALKADQPLYIELDKVYRQKDQQFIDLLNNLRNNKVTARDVEILDGYHNPGFRPEPGDNYIVLTTHNYKADSINRNALQELPGKSSFFDGEVYGDFNEYAYPVEKRLELRVGAQIMFIKNDPEGRQRYFNGKIAVVQLIDAEDGIIVQFPDDKSVLTLEQYTWKNIRYELDPVTNQVVEQEIGSFTHFPVKLAWAITVHKSQGLTFDKAILDIGSAFAPGQVYVALSRLRSLEGLILTESARHLHISLDPAISAFASVKEKQGNLEEIIKTESRLFTRSYLLRNFNFEGLNNGVNEHLLGYDKQEQKSGKQKHFEWALQLKPRVEELKVTADRFLRKLDEILRCNQPDYLLLLKERLEAATGYFIPLLKELSKNIQEHYKTVSKEKKVKAYLKELVELEGVFYKQQEDINKCYLLVKSLISGEDFSKQTLQAAMPVDDRQKEEPSKPEEPVQKKKKQVKGESFRETYELYKQGLGVEEIALARNMSPTTIEGHLSKYIASGDLEVTDFIPMDKVQTILSRQKKLGETRLTLLKQDLGDEYSYSDLKYALAFGERGK